MFIFRNAFDQSIRSLDQESQKDITEKEKCPYIHTYICVSVIVFTWSEGDSSRLIQYDLWVVHRTSLLAHVDKRNVLLFFCLEYALLWKSYKRCAIIFTDDLVTKSKRVYSVKYDNIHKSENKYVYGHHWRYSSWQTFHRRFASVDVGIEADLFGETCPNTTSI